MLQGVIAKTPYAGKLLRQTPGAARVDARRRRLGASPLHRIVPPGLPILPGANGDQVDMISGLAWMMQMMNRGPENWQKRKVRIRRDGHVYVKSRHWSTGAMVTTHYRVTNQEHALVSV